LPLLFFIPRKFPALISFEIKERDTSAIFAAAAGDKGMCDIL
jgi:hypothetical protein